MILSFSEPELHTVYKLPISYLRQVGLRSTNQLQAGRGIQKFPYIAYGGGGNIPPCKRKDQWGEFPLPIQQNVCQSMPIHKYVHSTMYCMRKYTYWTVYIVQCTVCVNIHTGQCTTTTVHFTSSLQNSMYNLYICFS